MQTAWAGEGPAALAPFGSGHHWLFREPRSSTADLPDAGDPDVRVRHAKPPRSKPATLAAVWLAPPSVAADSAFSSLNDTGRIRIRERTRVPCTTLDALAAELPLPVGLLKIDVEGLERAVIAGAAELLRRDRPVLLVEIYGGAASNPDPERTIADIRAYGYEPFVYADDAGLQPYQRHRDDRYCYFFIPSRKG